MQAPSWAGSKSILNENSDGTRAYDARIHTHAHVFIYADSLRGSSSAVMSVNSLFDTQFVVKDIDPDGKKFDRGRLSLPSFPNQTTNAQCRVLSHRHPHLT